MNKLINMFITVISLVLIILFLGQTKAFAKNDNLEIIKSDEQYIIYVKDLLNKDFKYAVSNDEKALDPNDINLNYINAVKDDDEDGGNSVALLTEPATFIYIKDEEDISVIQLDLSDSFNKTDMEEVEKTSKRIKTETETKLIELDETKDGVKYKITVGGLKIVDDETAKYEFISKKLPDKDFTKLQELADELSEKYTEKNMYEKIEFAKEFYNTYKDEISNIKDWNEVENLEIRQPSDSINGDKYIIILKKTSKDDEITYDAKFMTSYREDEEEKIPEKVETKTVKETTKLPYTGANLTLVIIFALVIIAIVVVVVLIRKNEKK